MNYLKPECKEALRIDIEKILCLNGCNTNAEDILSLVESAYKDKTQLVNDGCSFIDINDEIPSKKDLGTEFLVKLKYNDHIIYEVCEWFNPSHDGEIYDDMPPHFTTTNRSYRQGSINYEIVGWCRIQ